MRHASPVIVIGAGQAGLAMSWHLRARHIEHLVLEAHRAGHGWREQRWDSFHLVTPNWQCRLPGLPYDGDDPDGFLSRAQIVDYLDRYLATYPPPLREGVRVKRLTRDGRLFVLDTTEGRHLAQRVVVATGGYHQPIVPPDAATLDPKILQLTAAQYRNPAQLPPGAALVVGTGQSGAQIAEDLHLAGRTVHLCVGEAPRVARRHRGQDTVRWFEQMGWYDLPAEHHPLRQGDDRSNHYVSGCDGGRDIDLRQRAREGMRLYGKFSGIARGVVHVAPDLEKNLDRADQVAAEIAAAIDAHIAREAITAPHEPPYAPPWRPMRETTRLDLAAADITAIVWCLGFLPDFTWIAPKKIFDAAGSPRHHRGVTEELGLYFLGLPWQHRWGSGRFSGVGADAAYLADVIAAPAHPSDARAALPKQRTSDDAGRR